MPDLIAVEDRLRAVLDKLAAAGPAWFDRVSVVPEAGSTQDLAKTLARGRPGLVVIAARQTSGRGRLGRLWADTGHLGLAATFALDRYRFAAEHLAIASGVAACMTVEAAVSGTGQVGLRWPNDIVERRPDGGPGRKLAGVLVEVTDGLALIGVGINVLQRPDHWADALRARVASLRELGSDDGRAAIAERLVVELSHALGKRPEELAAQWTQRDLLVGSTAAFVHDGQTHRGVVKAIEPSSHIRLLVDGAREVTLPALATSMVHE